MENNLLLIRQPAAAGQEMVFAFEVNFIAVRLKNLTDGNIYIGFAPDLDKAQMVRIPPDCAEDFSSFYSRGVSQVHILPEGAGEVEARCLRW